MIIGITGTDGAGKGTVVRILTEECGFEHYSVRALLIKELEKRGEGLTRANMRLVANELRAKHGNDYAVRHYLEEVEKKGTSDAVIESIRAVAEAEAIQEQGGVLIAVDADQKTRYKRVQGRRSESDQVTFEQFVQHEALESNDPDPHGMQKANVIKMADYTIENNGSIEELREKVVKILDEIKGSQA